MEKLTVKEIRFSSFIKLGLAISFSFGIVSGILFFFIGLTGGDIQANLGGGILYGVPAAVASIFISPILSLFLGLFVSVLAYLPFKLLMKMTKGLKLKGRFEGEQNSIIEKE